MLSREAQKEHNKVFWQAFLKRMRKYPSSNGRQINWLSYPTDLKHLYLRLHAEKSKASLSLDLQWKDPEIRQLIWEQMQELRVVMENSVGEPGEWIESHVMPEGHEISRIQWVLNEVNYYVEKDHEKIYSFLEEKLLGFDEFYQEFKEILLLLVH